MFTWHHDNKKPRTRSLVLILLAWVFIGGQALLAAGSMYNYQGKDRRNSTEADGALATPRPGSGQDAVCWPRRLGPKPSGMWPCSWRSPMRLGVAALMCGVLLVGAIEVHQRQVDHCRRGHDHPGELDPEPALRLSRGGFGWPQTRLRLLELGRVCESWRAPPGRPLPNRLTPDPTMSTVSQKRPEPVLHAGQAQP